MDQPGGIHALQLRTQTPEEAERKQAAEASEQEEKIAAIDDD